MVSWIVNHGALKSEACSWESIWVIADSYFCGWGKWGSSEDFKCRFGIFGVFLFVWFFFCLFWVVLFFFTPFSPDTRVFLYSIFWNVHSPFWYLDVFKKCQRKIGETFDAGMWSGAEDISVVLSRTTMGMLVACCRLSSIDEVNWFSCLHLFWMAVFIDSEAVVQHAHTPIQKSGSADVNFIPSECLNRPANPV